MYLSIGSLSLASSCLTVPVAGVSTVRIIAVHDLPLLLPLVTD